MNDGNFPRPESGPKTSLSDAERRQYALEQQMAETRLEIIRSRRQQSEARVSRLVTFLFVFVAAGLVFYVLDAKGYDAKISIFSSIATIVVIGTWWAYRKPYS